MLPTGFSISTSVTLKGLFSYFRPAGGAATCCHCNNSNKMFFFCQFCTECNTVFLALRDNQIGKVVIFQFSIHNSEPKLDSPEVSGLCCGFETVQTCLKHREWQAGSGSGLTRPWRLAMTQAKINRSCLDGWKTTTKNRVHRCGFEWMNHLFSAWMWWQSDELSFWVSHQ